MKSRRYLIIRSLLFALFTLLYCSASAQDPTDSLPGDPGGVDVSKVQDLSFGAFSAGAGSGTVTISNSGTRSSTGGVTLLNLGVSYFNAVFDIEAPPGTIITVINGSNINLTGSNGGTATLQIGSCSPASPFTTTASPPSRTPVSIGGTLTVGSSPTPGTYSGTFSVTFNYQ